MSEAKFVLHTDYQEVPVAEMQQRASEFYTTMRRRRTVRDYARRDVPREVIEHALAHQLRDKVEAAYQRGDLLRKRVELMQAWADYCDSGHREGAS